jgi:hypothetical protein|tara:strand:+ start:2781 stop:3221 length:441 start_codon:yes stop_codon:yes gene_type:complete
MPEASKSYANWEILQDADSDISIQFNDEYPIDNYTYKARIVKDFDATTFALGSAGSIDYIEITQSAVTAAPSSGVQVYGAITKSGGDGSSGATPILTVTLYAIQTKEMPNSFEGKWDLLELDDSGGYIRQTQGDVIVNNSATERFT